MAHGVWYGIWRIPFFDIALTSTGISYSNGEVCGKDKVAYVDKLIQQGVVRETNLDEKGFFSLVPYLEKITEKETKIRKVIDFKKLNTYSKAWRSKFPWPQWHYGHNQENICFLECVFRDWFDQ